MYNNDHEIIETLFWDNPDNENNDEDSRIGQTSLPPLKPSYEQQIVINHIMDGDNVVVDSVSGSGKSTTILSCAEQLPNKVFLQLTYNSMLRKDVHEKVVARGLHNISVHTYHSLAVKYYHKDAHKDTVLRKILSANLPPTRSIPEINIVCLDESQDMSLLYYLFIVKFLRDMGGRIQVCVLGDYKQGIYQFKGADIRFLTKAVEIWSKYPLLSSPVFRQCALTMSYRITQQMADFVNDVMLGNHRLNACKSGSPVQYIRHSQFHSITIIKSRIARLLDEGESPSSIFILAASTKSKFVRKIENFLVERGIPCYVSIQDGEMPDERISNGKVVFTTFHCVKGRERKHVFVVGFDQTYFTYYGPEFPTDQCPNTLYVACTRGTDNLYVFESANHSTDRPLDFLQKTHFDMQELPYINFCGIPQKNFDMNPETRDGKMHYVTPTTLIRFISESVIDIIAPILERLIIVETPAFPELEIDIPIMIHTSRGFYEDVSILNGIAIPIMYYDRLFQKISSNEGVGVKQLLPVIQSILSETKDNEYTFLKRKIAELRQFTFCEAKTPNVVSPGIPQFTFCEAKTPNVVSPGIPQFTFCEAKTPNVVSPGIPQIRSEERTKDLEDSTEMGYHRRRMPETFSTPEEYLYLANLYVAVNEKLYFSLNQIGKNDYGWLTPDIIRECMDRFDETLGAECSLPENVSVEQSIVDNSMEEANQALCAVLTPFFEDGDANFCFSARTDLITLENVWELKCTTAISMEHQLQLLIYAWIWTILYPEKPREFRIFNIRSGEIQRLVVDMDDLTTIMVALLKGKYTKHVEKTDAEFLGGTTFPPNPLLR